MEHRRKPENEPKPAPEQQYPDIIPNAVTVAAMQERELKKFSSMAELMAALDADD